MDEVPRVEDTDDEVSRVEDTDDDVPRVEDTDAGVPRVEDTDEEVPTVEDMDKEVPRVENMVDDPSYKCPVQKVFRDIKGRRDALIKALTTDVEDFYQQCDPGKESLCLYGYANGEWRVGLPVEELPAELPEPVLGINVRRDEMDINEWLSLVAAHSNAWLLAVASYLCARAFFDKVDRIRVFDLLNNLPSLFEVVDGKQLENESSVTNQNSLLGGQRDATFSSVFSSSPQQPKDEEDEVNRKFNESGELLCEACSNMSPSDDFWICCNSCKRWFHGECVKITPAMPEHIKNYKCPSCTNKCASPGPAYSFSHP